MEEVASLDLNQFILKTILESNLLFSPINLIFPLFFPGVLFLSVCEPYSTYIPAFYYIYSTNPDSNKCKAFCLFVNLME